MLILRPSFSRLFATAASPASSNHHKVLVVGGGSAGLSVANMLYNRFADAGKKLGDGDIAILDGSDYHHYQPGWTLVGAGLAPKSKMRRTLPSLISTPAITHHRAHAASFSPSTNSLTTGPSYHSAANAYEASNTPGDSPKVLTYDYLVMATGLQTNFGQIEGLGEALKAGVRESGVGSIYSYEGCDDVYDNGIDGFQGKKAIFTQPKGTIKCAGAPQKVMWMARSKWNDKENKNVDVEFISGMPSMFGVPKYSKALASLAVERSVSTHFSHNLLSLSHLNKTATFSTPEGSPTPTITKEFDFLHVVPPQGPLDAVKSSPLADADGWVAVDRSSLQHEKYKNVFALGDCSSLPTGKTAAAVTSQTPVLVENLQALMNGREGKAVYDGYTSCPVLTGAGELILAEFKYGGQPNETFAKFGFDQSKPNRAFYHLKKDIFPFAYFNLMTKGRWYGRSGIFAPSYAKGDLIKH